MGILDLSPNYFLEDGERVLQDRSTILAYLEDLERSGDELRLVVQGHPSLPATVLRLEEEPPRLLVRLGRPLPVTWIRRKEIVLLFTLEGTQLLAPVRFLERGGYLETYLSLPEFVRHAERRSRMRAHFHAREKATVTVLEGLLGARGATGRLLDLSMEGLKMRVDRAITVRGQESLPVAEGTFPPGTRFPILRIDQLAYAPVVVCAAVLCHATLREGSLHLGMRFEGLGEMETQVLRQVLGRRLPKFSQGFPERRRKREASQDLEPRVVVVHHGAGSEPPDSAAPAADPNKAAKRLLLVLQDDLERAILVAALQADGYRRIHEARSYAEAMNHVKVFPMDAVILEERVGLEPAGDFLARLRQQGHCESVPKILLADSLDVRTRTLARTAKVDLVHSRKAGYEGEFRDVLGELLGL